MEFVRIILSALWVALMFAYLLGDVLRIYSGDFVPGATGGFQQAYCRQFVTQTEQFASIARLPRCPAR